MPKRINEWAMKYPDRVFSDEFARQRNYLTDETWAHVAKSNQIKAGSREYNMLPAKYRSTIYNNELGQEKNEFGKQVAEGVTELASYTPVLGDAIDATRAGMDFKQGNNLAGAIGIGSLLLPNMLEKPIKTIGKLINPTKSLNRIKRLKKEANTYIDNIASDKNAIYTNFSINKPSTPIGIRAKNEYINNNRDFVKQQRQLINEEVKKIYNSNDYIKERIGPTLYKESLKKDYLNNPTYNKFKNHLNYLEYALEMKAHPENPRTAAGFISRQRKSVRGIVAPNQKEGLRMLTEINGNRSGGDMLNTGGGLYTSNSFDVADSFSSVEGKFRQGTEGYIGYMKNNLTYDPNVDILTNLNNYKKNIGQSGNKRPMIESEYGSAAQRVYTQDMGLSLYKVIKKDDVRNKRGRWGRTAKEDPNLFKREYPSKLNENQMMNARHSVNYGKIIRENPIPNIESYTSKFNGMYNNSFNSKVRNSELERLNQLEEIFSKRANLLDNVKYKAEKGLILGGLGGVGYGGYRGYNYLSSIRDQVKNNQNNETVE